MISVESSGSFDNTLNFLKKISKVDVRGIMASEGHSGVNALANATPHDSGLASHTWGFKTSGSGGKFEIAWTNSDIENGFPVALMIQYGYGTGTGGYVTGRDYINPAMKPVFDRITDKVWKAVTSV